MAQAEGQPTNCEDRVKRMVSWLLKNRRRLTCADRVQIVFNCAGPVIRTEIKEGGEA